MSEEINHDRRRFFGTVAMTIAAAHFGRPPETWARRAYRNLIYFHEVDKGGHFAAWEQPQLFCDEIRAAFRSLQ